MPLKEKLFGLFLAFIYSFLVHLLEQLFDFLLLELYVFLSDNFGLGHAQNTQIKLLWDVQLEVLRKILLLPLEVAPVLAVRRQSIEHALQVRDRVLDLTLSYASSADALGGLRRGASSGN